MGNFSDVLQAEREEIQELRMRRGVTHLSPANDRTGICLSGGGIRSATFCLGVLQGLATYGLLRRFDYISSVSGGGYIASWLISWIKRPGKEKENQNLSGIEYVEQQLAEAPPHFEKRVRHQEGLLDQLRPPATPVDRQNCLSRLGRWILGTPKGEITHRAPELVCEMGSRRVPPSKYQEPGALNFLRAYSNYLTPRLGFFGADTWVAIASFVRNLLLNLTILVASLAAILVVPRFVRLALQSLLSYRPDVAMWAGVLAVLLIVLALAFADRNVADFSLREAVADTTGLKPDPQLLGKARQKAVLWAGVVPLFAACVLASFSLSAFVSCYDPEGESWLIWTFGMAGAYVLVRIVAQFCAWTWLLGKWYLSSRVDEIWWREVKRKFWVKEWSTFRTMLLFAPFAGFLAGLLLQQVARLFRYWLCGDPANISHIVSWGPPVLIAIILLGGVLHVGLMGLGYAGQNRCLKWFFGAGFQNQKREWWDRLAAWLLIVSLGWAFVFAIALFSPAGIIKLATWTKTKIAAITAWVASTLYGVLAGKSSKTSGEKTGSETLEILTSVAPYVFIVGTFILISYGVYAVLRPAAGGAQQNPQTQIQASGKLEVTGGSAGPLQGTFQVSVSSKSSAFGKVPPEYWAASPLRDLGILFGALVLVAAFLGRRVDINEFSLHLFYRNRLVRCYLGATNPERCPHPFTGFDPMDDILLAKFSAGDGKDYSGPYPILNAALNVTHGQRLAWQERRAESFVFTPRFCGYDFQEEREDEPSQESERGCATPSDRLAKPQMNPSSAKQRILTELAQAEEKGKIAPKYDSYRETAEYAYRDGGPYLGTAVAISGAAVNPNMGYHANSAVAFLLTVFNVRLGWWMGNPRRDDTWQHATPPFGLFYLLAELFGTTDDTSRYINLSDGGHFENLGLYELVRRECGYIVICDAGFDKSFVREDLGSAVRKCRSDFGVEIELDASALRPGSDGFSRAHYVCGTIHYADGKKGKLIYIKTALTGNEPQDILAYKAAHQEFPHQPTTDQWFDESQFESYRALGRFATESALERLGDPLRVAKTPTAQIFEQLA